MIEPIAPPEIEEDPMAMSRTAMMAIRMRLDQKFATGHVCAKNEVVCQAALESVIFLGSSAAGIDRSFTAPRVAALSGRHAQAFLETISLTKAQRGH